MGSRRCGGRVALYGVAIRHLARSLLLGAALVLLATPVAGAAPAVRHAPSATTAVTSGADTNPSLPRTDLEAEERDNGHTSQAPYLIWSGVASVVVLAVGGLLFKRRFDRENAATDP